MYNENICNTRTTYQDAYTICQAESRGYNLCSCLVYTAMVVCEILTGSFWYSHGSFIVVWQPLGSLIIVFGSLMIVSWQSMLASWILSQCHGSLWQTLVILLVVYSLWQLLLDPIAESTWVKYSRTNCVQDRPIELKIKI